MNEDVRGELNRRRVPPAGKHGRQGRGKAHASVELVKIPRATEFGSDAALCDPLELLAEFCEHEVGRQLIAATHTTNDGPGADRMHGFWVLVYLAYVLSGITSIRRFYNLFRSTGLWQLCEFERVPHLNEVYLRFGELHESWRAIVAGTDSLIRIAKAAVPQIGEIVAVDSSAWHSRAVLEHCCWNATDCRNAGGSPKAVLRNSANERITEERWKEVDAEEPDEGEPASPSAIEPGAIVERIEDGLTRRYRYFLISGHWYRSLDVSSGFRHYATGTSWFGGYLQYGICHTVGLPLALQVAPADIQEWDLYPRLFDDMVEATGEPPYIVTVDRGFGLRAFYEFNIRRGVAVVGGRRKRPGKTATTDWRCDIFDEHGIPRCPGCGGPGDADRPGMGLVFTTSGAAKLRFRCVAPYDAHCNGVHSIHCDEEYVMLLALSRLRELYWSARVSHHNLERLFIHGRERQGVAGKDVAGRLYQLGIPPQLTRAAAANLLNWFRLCLRHGWLPARTINVTLNTPQLQRLSGVQSRESGRVAVAGVGTSRLSKVLLARRDEKTDLPYGRYFEQLKERLAADRAVEEAA